MNTGREEDVKYENICSICHYYYGMTDFDRALVELTQNKARLQNDVMFAVRRGSRKADQVVIRAVDFTPQPDLIILYIAYPPTWRYQDRHAYLRKTAPYDLMRREAQRWED